MNALEEDSEVVKSAMQSPSQQSPLSDEDDLAIDSFLRQHLSPSKFHATNEPANGSVDSANLLMASLRDPQSYESAIKSLMQTTKHSQLVVLHALYVTSGRVALAEAYLRGALEGKLYFAPNL